MSISLKKCTAVLFALMAFFELKPYFLWSTYAGNLSFLIAPTLALSVVFGIIYFTAHPFNLTTQKLFILIYFSFLWLYMMFFGEDNFNYRVSGLYIALIFLIEVFLMKQDYQIEIYQWFKGLFAISLIPGIVVWFLLNLKINLPYEVIDSTNIYKTMTETCYTKYFGSVFLSQSYSADTPVLRLCGMFDEPGVVGTFSGLFLAGDNFRFKKYIPNIIILISGILSFSFAFYLMLAAGLVIKYMNKDNYVKLIALVLSLVGAYMLISTVGAKNVYINEFIQKRLQTDSDRNVRITEEFKMMMDDYWDEGPKKVLFGNGAFASKISETYSFEILFYDYGAAGVVLYIGWFIFAALTASKGDRKTLSFLILYLASIQQRPYVYSIHYIFVFYLGCRNLDSMRNENHKGVFIGTSSGS